MGPRSKGRLPPNPELDTAVLEDLSYLMKLARSGTWTNHHVRQAAGQLRRFLYYEDLKRCAGSWGIKIEFDAPDARGLQREAEAGRLTYYQVAGLPVLGRVYLRNITVGMPDARGEATIRVDMRKFPSEFDHVPENTVSLSFDSFCRQRVFFFGGRFITRLDVLLYVAHKAAAGHFDENRQGVDATLTHIRSAVKVSLGGSPDIAETMPTFMFDWTAVEKPRDQFVPSPSSVDVVFMELAATNRYLCRSKATIALHDALVARYGAPTEGWD